MMFSSAQKSRPLDNVLGAHLEFPIVNYLYLTKIPIPTFSGLTVFLLMLIEALLYQLTLNWR